MAEKPVLEPLSSNLVAELRADAENWQRTEYSDLVIRAADEIERLNAELARAETRNKAGAEQLRGAWYERDRLRALLMACKTRLVIAASSQYSVEAQLVRQITEALAGAADETTGGQE